MDSLVRLVKGTMQLNIHAKQRRSMRNL